MTDLDQFELRLAAAVRADADLGVGRFDPAAIARAAIVVGRSRSLRGRLHSAVFGDALRVPRRYPVTNMLFRLAAVTLVGVLAVGGAFYLLRPGPAVIGGPTPTPGATTSASPSASPTTIPSPTTVPARPASWTATGNMAGARQGGAAVLLQDGKVLVLGGWGPPWPPANEIYDPGTGTWTATGAMITARNGFAATLLPDGKVLVAGGAGDVGDASAELYDPTTGSWTATGSLGTARVGITATLLPDGRVLVAGGNIVTADGYTPSVASAELYDPRTGTWTATGSMAGARSGGTAVLLQDGKVLVLGDDVPPELYDPDTGKWAPTGTMADGSYMTPIWSPNATLLGNGRVLVIGLNGSTSLAELYDPTTDSWTATGSLSVPIVGYTATLLSDGRVLVAGGQAIHDVCAPGTVSAELYDPVTGTWGATSAMIEGRYVHTATLLPDGKVLVASGAHSGGGGEPCSGGLDLLSSAELYDPGSGH